MTLNIKTTAPTIGSTTSTNRTCINGNMKQNNNQLIIPEAAVFDSGKLPHPLLHFLLLQLGLAGISRRNYVPFPSQKSSYHQKQTNLLSGRKQAKQLDLARKHEPTPYQRNWLP
jgi:hypothetical protein